MSAGATAWAGALAVAFLVASLGGLVAFAVSMVLDGTFFDDVPGQSVLLAAFSVYAVVGALLLWRRPRHPIAWIMCSVGFVIGVGGASQGFAGLAVAGRNDPLPGGLTAAWISNWFWYVLTALMFIFMPLLFPTGRLLSRWWRPIFATAAAATCAFVILGSLDPVFDGPTFTYTNPIGIGAVEDVENSPAGKLLYGLMTGCGIAAWISLVVRFRRAHGVERAQIKWVAYAFLPCVGLFIADFIPAMAVYDNWPLAIAIAAVPVAIAIAVLRYRLYDIDRLISRTISYGVVTALLVATYTVLVIVMQEVMPVYGDFTVAASTLTVAVLFNPLRRRVQAVVDRRFNRAGYDAARTITAFSERLRNQVDVYALIDDLQDTTSTTMQPASMSVWLRSKRELSTPSTDLRVTRRPGVG